MPCFLPLISSSSRTRSVSSRPGTIWLTRIFAAASSSASVFDSADTDARSTVDRPRFGIGSLTDDDVDTRIAPPPRAFIDGTAARIIRSVLKNSRFVASCHAASSNDSAGPAGGPPALAKSRSTPPSFRSSRRPRSECVAPTGHRPPSPARRAVSARDRRVGDRALVPRRDRHQRPFGASAFATAKPSPRLAPATMATFPFSPRSIDCSSFKTSARRAPTAAASVHSSTRSSA